jgi:CheY-like chemotaxis protein
MRSPSRRAGAQIVAAAYCQDVADGLAMLLRSLDAQVRVAYDGATAIEILAEFKPDIAFIDIGMPGMDGFETARQIRELPDGKRLSLFALSGWSRDEDRRRATEAGLDGLFAKPIAIEDLESLPC